MIQNFAFNYCCFNYLWHWDEIQQTSTKPLWAGLDSSVMWLLRTMKPPTLLWIATMKFDVVRAAAKSDIKMNREHSHGTKVRLCMPLILASLSMNQ